MIKGDKWWRDKPPQKDPVECQSCGKNAANYTACCPNERMRRARTRRARIDAENARMKEEAQAQAKAQANERRNARRREQRAAKKPFEECKHCGGNALAFYICCEARREERALASTQKYNESRAGSTSKPKPKPHVCVDCGVKTPDRRCDKCRAKWHAKHGVSSSAHSLSADWSGF